ncbi:MAG: tetratricopeptide repeat protein, partial [Nitrospirae bacterium]|nr:tetratricopeptide repeat protein [Nitrospirota bacterium]
AWIEYKTQYSSGQVNEAAGTLDRIRTKAAEKGFERLDLLSAVMIREGEEALSKKKPDEAVELGTAAQRWSPGDPNASFFLAKALTYQHPFKPYAAIRAYLEGLSAAAHDFWFSFYILGRSVVIFGVGFIGSFIVFYVFLLIRYLPLLVHGLEERGSAVLNRPAAWISATTLLFIPLSFGAGAGFALLAGICLFWLFMTKNERRVSASFVAAWSLAVLWLPMTLSWFTADQSTELMLLTQVFHGDAAATATARSMETQGGKDQSWPVLFSLALQKKREENFDDAMERYLQLEKLEPDRSIILNNIGNIYFALKDYDQAAAFYKKSFAQNHQDATSHYNLNLIYREMLRFEEAKQEYETAQQINLPLIQSYQGEKPVDELFPETVLWKTAFTDSPVKEALSRELFKSVWKPLPLNASPMLLIFLMGGVFVIRWVSSRKYTATVCAVCGQPICFHCQRRVFDLKICAICWSSFKNIKRKSDIRQIRYRRRWLLRTARMLSAFFPGTGHLYIGRGASGFIFSTLFLGMVCVVFFQNAFFRMPGEYGSILGPGSGAVIVSVLLVLYIQVFRSLGKASDERS